MTSTQRPGRAGLKRIGTAALLLAIAGAAPALARNPLKLPGTQYEPIAWAQIDGWADDDHDAAFATFLQSCKAILQGAAKSARRPADVRRAVQGVPEGGDGQSAEARRGARLLRAELPAGPHLAARHAATASSPAITSRSSKASARKAEGYDHPLYRKPASLLPGGHMAVAGAPAAGERQRQEKETRPASASWCPTTTAPRSTTACWPDAIWKSAG